MRRCSWRRWAARRARGPRCVGWGSWRAVVQLAADGGEVALLAFEPVEFRAQRVQVGEIRGPPFIHSIGACGECRLARKGEAG
jgi:hypothetical protein